MTEALTIFEQLGTPLWAARARTELARTAESPQQHLLTATEQRVAELVASGLTNKDVAAALYISPKTVEHNLGRVYRKLGIRNRTELGRQMDSLRDGPN
ncbi:helix-turn-helix domain-containing protein [Mycolicibacterium gilvum]|uniref:helix-turn-helix domain-containing protein n=1 Tax=Mycolicibacterium gilvum TaxID=1804 RepID=UPI0040453D77